MRLRLAPRAPPLHMATPTDRAYVPLLATPIRSCSAHVNYTTTPLSITRPRPFFKPRPQASAQPSPGALAVCLCNCRVGARVCMGLGPAQPKEDREGAIGHRKASPTGTLDTLPTFALAGAPSLSGPRPPR